MGSNQFKENIASVKMVRQRVVEASVINGGGSKVLNFWSNPKTIARLKYIGVYMPSIPASVGTHDIYVGIGNADYSSECLSISSVPSNGSITCRYESSAGVCFDEVTPLVIRLLNNSDLPTGGNSRAYVVIYEEEVIY